jgi:hypothetical protein
LRPWKSGEAKNEAENEIGGFLHGWWIHTAASSIG